MPSNEECITALSSCIDPWRIATALGYADELPQCDSLPSGQ